jgi:DNA-binding beta-propeller fold protein YncE
MTTHWMRGPRGVQSTTLVLVAAILGVLALAGAYPASSMAAARAKSAQRGSVMLTGSPGVPAANPQTNTVYVPIQCRASFCSTPTAGHVVDVINAARCDAKNVSGCRVLATVRVGKSPLAAVLDVSTDSIYVVNSVGSVSVLNGARCNATFTRGCTRAIATITTGGGFTVAGAVDPVTRTLYVASLKGDVFAINIARCNAAITSGCRQPVKKIIDRGDPDAIDVDVATDTVYAANAGPNGNGSGDTLSMIDGAQCNGRDGRGCHRAPRTIRVGSNPEWDTVDQKTNTVYVANFNDGTVSVINGARCNATVDAGCTRPLPAVTTGAGTGFVAIDNRRHSLFAVNSGDDTLSAINTTRCAGAHPAECPNRAPAQQAGSNQGPGYAQFPDQLALMPRTGSAYLVNEGGSNVMAVADVSGCDAINASACRHDAPNVSHDHDYLATIDPLTNTIYASRTTKPEIDVLDALTCRAGHLSACTPVAEIPIGETGAGVGAIDDVTHTLYASGASSISVINTATCNAATTTGCGAKAPTIPIGTPLGIPTLNPATQTLYVAFGKTGSRIAAINAGTCNAQTTSGCGTTHGVINVGAGTNQLAVSTASNTIYAPAAGRNYSGDTIAVINGATCDATDLSGCGQPPATVKVGVGPDGVAVNDLTHTIYVANNADGDGPGTVSVINGATCDGATTTGCAPIAGVAVGRAPLLAAIDTATDHVYVTNYASATVSIIDGQTCNAGNTTGCSRPADAQAVGSSPFGLAIDNDTNTVYALTDPGPGAAASIFDGPL